MSTICRPCISAPCNFPDDLDLYSLDGLQFNRGSALYFVFECPPDFECNTKHLPWEIRIQCCGRTIVGNVPGGATPNHIKVIYRAMADYCYSLTCGPTSPWELRLRCCNTWIKSNIPASYSRTQRYNLLQTMLNRCAQIQPSCNDIGAEASSGIAGCRPCLPLDCDFPNDLEIYSLDGLQFFLGNQLFFVFDCPPGFDCQIKPFPWDMRITCCGKTIASNVPGGSSFAQIQNVYRAMLDYCFSLSCGTTSAWEIRLRCCSTWLVASVPATATHVQRENAMISLLNRCQQITPTCNEIPDVPPDLIIPPVKLGDLSVKNGCLGGDFFATVSATSKALPITFSISGGSLPPGLAIESINANSAKVFGTATTAGNYTFTIMAINALFAKDTRDYTIAILGITNCLTIPDAKCDNPYTFNLTAAGGTPPYTFSLDPDTALPAGLVLDADGTIHGTPTGLPASNFVRFVLRDSAVDVNGNPTPHTCTCDTTITVTGPKFLNSPPDGMICAAYSFQIETSPDHSLCTFAGTLPAGLTIDAGPGPTAGLITGSPKSRGAGVFAITATNGPDSNTLNKTVNIAVNPAINFVVAARDLEAFPWTVHGLSSFGTPTYTIQYNQNAVTIDISVPIGVYSGVTFQLWNRFGRCALNPTYTLVAPIAWTVVGAGAGPGSSLSVGWTRFKGTGGLAMLVTGGTTLTIAGCSGGLPNWQQIPTADNETFIAITAANTFIGPQAVSWHITISFTPSVPTGEVTC